jgi:F-type H+-transporting ATPase subunit a
MAGILSVILIVNWIYKVILTLALLCVTSALSLKAETAVTKATETIHAAAAEHSAPLVSGDAPTLFKIGQFPITNSVVYAWVVAIVIIIFVRVAMRGLRADKAPSGLGNLLESIIEGWDSLNAMILEPKVSRWVFPFAVTFFLFALTSNLLGLLPGVGSIGYGPKAVAGENFSSLPFAIEHANTPLLRPPTADANMTVVMALIFLVMSLYWALKYNGPIGLIKHIFGVKVEATKWVYPLLLLMFIFVGAMEALSIVFVRPLALAIRLYGNIFAGESLLALTMSTKPFIVGLAISIPFYFFELFVAVVQAFVFAMLTLVFAGTLCSHTDEEHGH